MSMQAALLWAAGQRGDNDEFLRLDVEFLAAVLNASGNAMFAQQRRPTAPPQLPPSASRCLGDS
ncbi:UNVERIFIED_ORG: DNA-binding GntR family transcriptional regulator [Arthrobacter sp. UYCu721]